MVAKPKKTCIIPAENELMIALSNGTMPSTDYWGHTKAKLVIGKSQRGGKVKKQI